MQIFFKPDRPRPRSFSSSFNADSLRLKSLSFSVMMTLFYSAGGSQASAATAGEFSIIASSLYFPYCSSSRTASKMGPRAPSLSFPSYMTSVCKFTLLLNCPPFSVAAASDSVVNAGKTLLGVCGVVDLLQTLFEARGVVGRIRPMGVSFFQTGSFLTMAMASVITETPPNDDLSPRADSKIRSTFLMGTSYCSSSFVKTLAPEE